MQVSVETEGDKQVIRLLDSRIDASAALDFKEVMRRTARESTRDIVLDMEQIDFIDSSGLGAIVATLKHLAPQKRLILAAVTPPVDRVFKLTRMDSIFAIFPTVQGAVDAPPA